MSDNQVPFQSPGQYKTKFSVPKTSHKPGKPPRSRINSDGAMESQRKLLHLRPVSLLTHAHGKLKQSLRGFKERSASLSDLSEKEYDVLRKTLLLGYNELCESCQRLVETYISAVDNWTKSKAQTSEAQSRSKLKYNDSITKVFGHLDSFGTLRKSAKSGCHLCNLLDSADPCYPFTYDEENTTPYSIQIDITEDGDHHMGFVKLKAEGYSSDTLNIVEGTAQGHIPSTLICLNTNAPEVLELAAQWLQNCLQTHGDCRTHTHPLQLRPFIPTRLIKVKSTKTGELSANLVCTKKTPILGNGYVTLSHCWGGADVLRLTLATVDAFRTELPLSTLPKNFLDAFEIALRLGYQYIWIDSLCIIQDSARDWESEAGSMGEVYQHSACTIAATGAKNSHGGCFAQRSTLALLPCQLSPGDFRRPSIHVEARLSHQSYKPLHSRAWALQERCLSVRTISFGSDQISWECVTAQASEQEPCMSDYLTRDLSRDFHEMLNAPSPTWTLQKWWELISEYTKCEMTYEKDKWPAIQGLASQVSRAWETTLFYGLWDHRLLEELFWVVVGKRHERLHIGAPSWSWLSVKGQVHYKWGLWSTQNHVIATVKKRNGMPIQASLPAQNNAPELEITANFLRLRSDVMPSTQTDWYQCCLSSRHHFDLAKSSNCEWNARWSPDTALESDWEIYAIQMISLEPIFQAGLAVIPTDRRRGLWKRVGLYEVTWRTEAEWETYRRVNGWKSDGEIGERMAITLI